MSNVHGRHWLIDCSGCACADGLLASAPELETACVAACRDAGLRVVGSVFHQFAPAGATGVVLLAESHLAVHTWPGERFAAVDVYVCNHERDNGAKGAELARAISMLFAAARCTVREILRDSVEALD